MPKLARLFHAKGRKVQFGVVKLAECSLSLLKLTLVRVLFAQVFTSRTQRTFFKKSILLCQDFHLAKRKKPFLLTKIMKQVVLPIIGRWLEVVNGVERRRNFQALVPRVWIFALAPELQNFSRGWLYQQQYSGSGRGAGARRTARRSRLARIVQ